MFEPAGGNPLSDQPILFPMDQDAAEAYYQVIADLGHEDSGFRGDAAWLAEEMGRRGWWDEDDGRWR